MGTTRDDGSQQAMWVATADLPQGGGHPFYERLNEILGAAGFDAFVEQLCAGAIRRVINLRIKGASIYWLPESVDAILLLRSFYKSGRWNCLQRMAMTPVGVSA